LNDNVGIGVGVSFGLVVVGIVFCHRKSSDKWSADKQYPEFSGAAAAVSVPVERDSCSPPSGSGGEVSSAV
jgi:hypothetical protein